MGDKLKKEKNQHIQVFVRVRPLNHIEKNKSSHSVIDTTNKDVTVKTPLEKASRTFAYDKVFGPESKQIEVYKAVVSPLIEEVLAGYNCTVFAYGQTGTGKTHTMEGFQSDNLNVGWDSDPSSGIIPRTLSHLFDELRVLQAEFCVRVSFLELYNEELFDLLSPNDDVSKIKLYEDVNKKGSVIISGLEEVTVNNKNEVYKILEKGSFKRQTAATLMNAHSSRSHTVFSITVHIKENSLDGEELLKTGKLNLVDLAGSENVGKSGAIDKRAREAGNINQSLLTLGRCITSLVERTPHVPFRESKLTRLLQDSLGGRTKTSIIATISPAACNMEETLSTLDYALRAKNITNRPEINQKLTKKALLREYTEEIERLKRDLAATREKNGTYLSNDNYTEMIDQLAAQEQEILDKIANLRAVNEEMEKKQVLLNELHISLEEKSEKLRQTTDILVQTRQTLHETKGQLKEMEQDRDMHSHLVEKHVETEQKLGKEAKELMAVADQSTTDTYRLHDKLSRKRSVDETNEQISREFRQGYQQKLSQMVDDVGLLTQDQLKAFATLQTNLGTHLEAGTAGFATVSDAISSLVNSVNLQTQDLQKKTTDQASSSQEWVQQYLNSKRTHCDTEGNAMHEYRVELMPKTQNLARQVQALESGHNEHARYVNQQLLHQRKKIEGHTATQDQKFAQFRDTVLQLIEAQQGKTERTQRSVLSLQADVNAMQEKIIDELSLILERAKLEQSVTNQSFAEIDVEFSRSLDNYKKLSKTVVEVMDSESNNVKMFNHVYQNDINDLNENVDSFVEQSLSYLSDVKRITRDVEAVTTEAMVRGEEAWKEDYGWCEQELRQRSEMVHSQLQAQQHGIQGVQGTVRDAAECHDGALERQRAELGSFVRDARTNVDAQAERMSEWSEAMGHELHQRDQEVDKFLTEDLRRDMPTGTTPARKEFQYSRLLSATSPHDRIVARFRAQRQESLEDQPEEASPETSTSEELVMSPAKEADTYMIRSSSSLSDIPSSSSASTEDLNLSVSSEPGVKHANKENGRIFALPMKVSKSRTINSKSARNINTKTPQSGHKAPLSASSFNQH